MRTWTLFVCVCLIASAAVAGGPTNHFPNDMAGQTQEWQSRASMWLSAECTGNKCDEYEIAPGTVYVFGAVYWFGTDVRVIQFGEYCVWDGTVCGDRAALSEPYDVWLTWDEDAQAYLRIVEVSPDVTEFESLTMTEPDAGFLQIGEFEIRGKRVYQYSKDVAREVWTLERWWPAMPPEPGPV